MGKQGRVLRLVPLLLALALVLSACGLSTDTVATVGGEGITRGQLRAFANEQRIYDQSTGNPESTDGEVLQTLINIRWLELVAQERKVSVTPQDIDAEVARLTTLINDGGNGARGQRLTSIATTTVSQIRPLINASGGSAIPDASLLPATQETITNLLNLLNTRGTIIPVGYSTLPDRVITDQAIAFRNLLAGQGIGLLPVGLEPVIREAARQLEAGGLVGVTAADDFQLYLTQTGDSNASFRRAVKIQLLAQKLAPAQVDAAYFQALTTDSRDKANEAVQKARAGTPFADLIKQYQLPTVPTSGPDNLLPTSYVVSSFPAQLRASFKAIAPGEVSDPITSADGGQFTIYRIARIESRPVVDQDLNGILNALLLEAQKKYPVVYVDTSLEPTTMIP